MISAVADVDPTVWEHTRSVIGSSAGVMRTAVQRRVRKVKSRLRADLKAPGDFPDLPFVWSYDPVKQAKARRWYFANKVARGSRGGRYQRTGDLEAAWDILFEGSDGGAVITLENSSPGAEFVYGERQVPSHYATGWAQLDDLALRYRDELNLGLIEDWFTASDPTAGVR